MNKELSTHELKNISGGAIRLGILAGIASLGIFIISVIDGYLRPLSCNK